MKRAAALLLFACILVGCGAKDDSLEQAMELRAQILNAQTCSFQAVVTADYTDALYTFQMECDADTSGSLTFTVLDPETIAGITGCISQETAALTFDDQVLSFPMLADDQLTPVSAPWLFLNSIKSGYLSGCSREESGLTIYIDDSFREKPVHVEIITDENILPIHSDILWQGRRVLSVDIQNFTIR